MSILTLDSHISYDDIDQNMNLSLKGALRLMQEAAMIHSGQVGFSVADVEKTRVTWMLVQWRVRLVNPVRWSEKVTVYTWPKSMERATSMRNFEILGSDESVAAIGESNWVLVSADTGRIVRITPQVAAAYDLTSREVFSTPMPEIVSAGGEVTWRSVVGRRDIDTNRHVNNRVYLDYAKEALPEDACHILFREVSVRYRKQLLPGDSFCCRYSCCKGKHMIDICEDGSEIVHGTVVFSE